MKIKYFIIIITLAVLFSCKEKPVALHKISGKQININDSIAGNEDISGFVAPYRDHLNKTLDSPLAYSPKALPKKYKGVLNIALGNLLADLIYEQTNPVFKQRSGKEADFVLLNHGGIRSPIAKGNITTRTAYEVMPFENKLVVVELAPEKVEELLNYLAKRKRAHPISSQLNITVDSNDELKEVTVNGKPVEKDRTYHVITSDYLMRGGDKMLFFADAVSVTETDYLVRNAIIDYFKKIDTISATADNRFIKVD